MIHCYFCNVSLSEPVHIILLDNLHVCACSFCNDEKRVKNGEFSLYTTYKSRCNNWDSIMFNMGGNVANVATPIAGRGEQHQRRNRWVVHYCFHRQADYSDFPLAIFKGVPLMDNQQNETRTSSLVRNMTAAAALGATTLATTANAALTEADITAPVAANGPLVAAAVLAVLGVVLVIWGGKKVIGFFGR